MSDECLEITEASFPHLAGNPFRSNLGDLGKHNLNMTYLTFKNGHKMPLVGLGMWQADDPNELEQAVETALELGYRHFDTATLYRNEGGLGKVLKRWLDSGRLKRDELFIVTKLPWTGMAPERVELFLNSSLKALQLDYVDLYLVHWPIGLVFNSEANLIPMKDGEVLFDKTTDLEAVWQTMEKQVDAKKVRSIGISNFNASQVERIMRIARIPPSNHQYEVHAYFQQKELLKLCNGHGITVCAYGPLGSPGRASYKLPGLGVSAFPPVIVLPILEDPVVVEISKKYNKTAGQILLRFLTQLNIAVIPKSVSPERLKQNISIFDFELSSEDLQRLEALDKGEDGRSFQGLKGVTDHPECPWMF